MKVLFVCMGNICRSPTAEGVFRKLIAKSAFSSHWEVDSAGTLGFHAGDPPDSRSIAHAARREIDLTMLRARKVAPEDFERFDYVIAMDENNVQNLKAICPDHLSNKIDLLLNYADEHKRREVPDPYHGEAKDFELVLDLIESGCQGLINHLSEQQRTRAQRSSISKE